MLPPAPSIGGLQLSSPLLLAPLSGYTNVAFRLGVRRLGGLGGLGLAFTDLANPIGVMRRNLKTKQILATCEEDRPLAVQLYGADAGNMAEAARALAGGGTEIIDINMGCPVHKVVRKGGGSALLADPERAARLAARVVAAVDVPVTVKLRLGTDAANITAPRLTASMEISSSCSASPVQESSSAVSPLSTSTMVFSETASRSKYSMTRSVPNSSPPRSWASVRPSVYWMKDCPGASCSSSSWSDLVKRSPWALPIIMPPDLITCHWPGSGPMSSGWVCPART